MAKKVFELDADELEEFKNDLMKMVPAYEELAEQRLKRASRKFKKAVIAKTEAETKTRSGQLVKGYKLSKVSGSGANMEIDFSGGKAPHFHLVENGHNLIVNGKRVGWVNGKHMVKNTRQEFAPEMLREMELLRKAILRKAKLDG